MTLSLTSHFPNEMRGQRDVLPPTDLRTAATVLCRRAQVLVLVLRCCSV